MARVSFTVRGTASASVPGSYLRYADGSASPGLFPARTNYDSALRADGYQLPSTVSTLDSTFSATAIGYGTAQLDWTVPIYTAVSSPLPVSSLLVYSPNGVPQTIASGTVLVDTAISPCDFVHDGLPQGQWAYYSLFLHYSTNPLVDDYYERVAEVEILIPTDYGSTLRLWDQIPSFAQMADIAQGDFSYSPAIGQTHGDAVGPLFKFLSIIGFDMDRIRTLIDFIMVSKDPLVANSEVLESLADMMGLPLSVQDLGDMRLRALLDDIGVYRRSKGTLGSVSMFTSAVTGSSIALNTTTNNMTIYSQRANYITNPKTGVGLTSWRAANNTEAPSDQAFSTNYYSAHTADVTNTSNAWSTSVPGTNALVRLSSPVPVLLNDFVQFSVHGASQNILWARLTLASNDTVIMGTSLGRTFNGVRYFEIPVTAGANLSTFTTGRIEFMLDLTSTFTGQLYLAEVNHIGDYFDGSTVRGGWLVGTPSVSDYRWSGSADSSVSIYAEDYKRTQGAIQSLFNTTIPITAENRYAISTYNGIRGF